MKKIISVFLSVVMLVSALSVGTVAFADENKTPKTATVEYSVFDGGVYTMEPKTITVSSDLSDKYKNEVGYNDKSDEPTILDVLIAAHIDMFGEEFTDYAPLKASGSSGITSAFGEETSALSYRLNGATDNGSGVWYNLDTEVKSGDYVDTMFYQDTSGYTDKYVSLGGRDIKSTTGDVTLTATYEGFDANWATVILPAQGLNISVDGVSVGTTDENGQITLKLSQCKTYVVTASGEISGSKIFEPYTRVAVATQLYNALGAQLSGGADFLLKSVDSLTIEKTADFLAYLNGGANVDKYKADYVASVKSMLDSNNGKLVSKIGGEVKSDLALYGAVIPALEKLGYDAKKFEGYNLVSAFESTDTDSISNPYYYRVAIEAASSDFAHKLIDKFIADDYTIGSGMKYWGFSCDNTAMFLTSIAKYADDYSTYVDDAKQILKTYTTDTGAFYSYQYNDVNANSTALCAMAYAALGDNDTAFSYYKNLVEGFEDTTGVFTYNGKSDVSATKQSYLALTYFKESVGNAAYEHKEHVAKNRTIAATTSKDGAIVADCRICGETFKTVKTIAKINAVSLSSSSYTYDGSAKKPGVTVTDANGAKIASSNYSVAYSNNVKKGTATATVTFKGNYSGTVKKTFIIYPAKVSNVKLSSTSYTYNGKTKTPSVTVKDNKGRKLKNGTDYTVKYSSGRKNVGKYAVKVTFKGNYSGTVKKTFKINPAKVSNVKLSSTSYTYNGKTKTPSVTVKDSKGRKLKKGTDYTVKYSSGRKNVGRYAVKVTFKGNYTGSKTVYYYIVPKSTSISRVSALRKGFKLSWKKQKTQTTGYQIQYSTSKKFKKAKAVNVSKNKTTSKSIKKLSSKKKYYVRVRTYKKVKINGKTKKVYSSWSKTKTVKTR
ncbi:MAG: hypothetical protein BHV89_21095 [Clostridiales bacterium 41_21_two_genomes]|mgnify:FL=1|nr:MAG: hypothetical protein BHV89_21095 [Clostridiales bacterium 41_21_two_genomes]